ncbi:hypothetical protein SKAU_G00426180 [Synaphobranchus kaupii]|uniref:Teneurin NHL domain-containing protein n=1 Tax=Synaphobranchus kaupii TaxID=118154 RepID=A0A9Q1I9N8_SYNKA|nr:hypothetical protein SKAU_G00426180 [Synaphobranchus kaupii]
MRNGQRVYGPIGSCGVCGVRVRACPSLILWEKRTAVLQGFELHPSNLGGWSLDKQHILNTRSGILHKGSGENLFCVAAASRHLQHHGVYPSLNTTGILELRNKDFRHSNNPTHKYFLAVDPVSGMLFISDTNSRRIYRVHSLDGGGPLADNAEVVAGDRRAVPAFRRALWRWGQGCGGHPHEPKGNRCG